MWTTRLASRFQFGVRIAALGLVAGCLPFLLLSEAADHRDGPVFSSNLAVNGRQDINDMYIFQSPTNSSNMVLAMTVSPFSGSVTPVTFDHMQFFDFRVDNNGDAVEDITFRTTFSAPDGNGVQQVTVRGLPAARFPPTGIVASGKTGQNLNAVGGGRFRAANHDDPFAFDVTAFNTLLNGGGFPRPVGEARNFFRNANTLTLVLEIPTSRLIRPGNPNIGIWGRTEKNGVQIDRMGRPAINTALIPPLPRGSNFPNPGPDRRNAFNAGAPNNDRRDFRRDMIGILKNFYNPLAKRTDAEIAGLADFLLPDILTVNTSIAFGDPSNGFPNGRRLRDDVIDVELNLLTKGAVTTDNVGDDNANLITDGTNGTTAAFPYFGAPNNPAGAPNP